VAAIRVEDHIDLREYINDQVEYTINKKHPGFLNGGKDSLKSTIGATGGTDLDATGAAQGPRESRLEQEVDNMFNKKMEDVI
jgi:hypothetical protein